MYCSNHVPTADINDDEVVIVLFKLTNFDTQLLEFIQSWQT